MVYYRLIIILCIISMQIGSLPAQHMDNPEPENDPLPLKIMHAEPLYIDLIRDLGARKGEKEWNVGMGMKDNLTYDSYEVLVEYEFAPINRLGIEFEVPLTFYSRNSRSEFKPSNRIESVKSAAQYTFLVHQKARLSAAVGYLNELELESFNTLSTRKVVSGNLLNPFLVVAKRIGTNFHTLIYTGPQFLYHFSDRTWEKRYELNTNVHYMIPSSRNFLGLELNKHFSQGEFNMVIRPQMRLGIADNLLIGIVPGIPVSRQQERLSFFMRLIYEPKERKHKY